MDSSKFLKIINLFPTYMLHIIGWSLYLLYSYFINRLTTQDFSFIDVFAINTPLITFFYLCVYGFYLFKKNITLAITYFIVSFTLLFLGGFYFITSLLPKIGIEVRTSSFSFSGYTQEVVITLFKFLMYALLYFIISQYFEIQKNLKQIEIDNLSLTTLKNKEELEAMRYQYAFLKSQVNPHFLFNTLNVLFSQALKVSEPLANNILKLSEIMRYSIDASEEGKDWVYLQKELDQLQKILDIYQLRFSDRKPVLLDIQGEIKQQKILAFSLITAVENAFKYGEINEEDAPLELYLKVNEKDVFFKLKNKKKKNTTGIISNNIGLNNLKQRLDIYFPNAYNLDIDETTDFYSLTLEFKQI